MNAVAKSVVSHGWLDVPFSFSLAVPNLRVILLCVLIFMSAFATIYVKDVNRCVFIELQDAQQAKATLDVNYGKLLLEEGAWSTQARVQSVAEQQLNMEIPTAKDVVMVKIYP